jgi:hypothetical protein
VVVLFVGESGDCSFWLRGGDEGSRGGISLHDDRK